MVADTAFRRRGVAASAVLLMMEWGRRVLGIHTFVAKISVDNAPSLALFTQRLGFVEASRLPAFGEVHLVRGPPWATPDEGEFVPLPPSLADTDAREAAQLLLAAESDSA